MAAMVSRSPEFAVTLNSKASPGQMSPGLRAPTGVSVEPTWTMPGWPLREFSSGSVGPSSASASSPLPRSVIRVAGIHQIATGGAQQSFDLLDRFPNYAARVAGFNLPLQLEERLVGAIEALRQDRCNVKERGRVYPEYG